MYLTKLPNCIDVASAENPTLTTWRFFSSDGRWSTFNSSVI